MISLSKKFKLLSTAAVFAALAVPAAAASYYPAQQPAPAYQVQPQYAAVPASGVPRGASPNNYVSDPSVPLWAGPYVGGHIGAAYSEFSNEAPTAGPSGSSGSLTGGAQVGYLWQSNRLVYGVEGDASWLDLTSNGPGSHFHEGYSITARGRLGYAVGPWLPYVTGGVAFTNVRFENAAGASTENFEPGFTGGAGVERFINPRWSMKAEYLFVDVPKQTENVGGTTIAGGSGNSTARVGLNYHF